jgi:signal transduction histidine kinase/ligand-binding sensor domain-containing protein
VLLALVLMQDAGAERQFTTLGAGRSLDARIVTSLLVDRDGLLWVTSREGLYRYDGYEATAFLPDPGRDGSVSELDIRSLYEADDGTLWVATNTNGVNRRDAQTGEFSQLRHDPADPRSLSHPSVFAVAQDAGGQVWAGTRRGLNRLEPDGRGFTHFLHEPGNDQGLVSDWVYALHRGASGRFWIGTLGGGISRWIGDKEGFESFSLAGLSNGPRGLDDVFAIHEAPDGRIWAGTREGLVVLDPVKRTAERLDLINDPGAQLIIAAMHADRYGRLWLATFEHGVFGVDLANRAVTRVPVDGLGATANAPKVTLLSITTTDHLLLVGTWGQGVYRAPLEDPVFRFLPRGEDRGGLRYPNVTAVLAHSTPGRPWIATFGSGPYRVDVETGQVLPTQAAPIDPDLRINTTSLAVTPDGSHFAGASEGLYRFAEDGRILGVEAHAPDRPDGIGRGPVTALLPADASDLWVGVLDGGLFLREASSARYRAHRHDPAVADSLSSNYVTALRAGQDGLLWVGTLTGGLNRCRIQPWSCQHFDGRADGPGGLRGRFVTALRHERGGGLWVTTNPGGLHLARFDPDGREVGFERWDTQRGLLSDSILSVEADDDGTVWVSSPLGLSHLDPATGRIENHVLQSGLPVSNFNFGASAADRDFIYFGAVQGLVSFPRGTPLRQRSPTPVRIIGAERLSEGAWRPLPPALLDDVITAGIDDVLAFEFAVLDFAESSHEYAYRLRPTDEWTPLGRRREVTFVGLEPGPYRFEVRGRDVFGQWNTSPALELRVDPPFWMTLGFRSAALAGIVLLALGLHLARLRSLQRRNAVLEQLQHQRELALDHASRSGRELEEASTGLRQLTRRLESVKEQERSRISRELHDEFGQTLTAAKINLQMLRGAEGDAALGSRLDEAVGMVDRMIRQARDIARGLRPPLLDEAGLVPALEDHVKALGKLSDVRIELDAGPGVANVPPALNTTLFRVIQEALNNALRHARATTISVVLRDEPDAVSIVIQDDGVGFDPDAVGRRIRRGEHLGLLGMTERVRSVGGTIDFDSRPGAGSRIRVRIPFPIDASGTGAPLR